MSKGFPGGSDDKESVCNAGDPGSIPGSRRSPGEEKGNPLQHVCLENPMDRGAWWDTVHEAVKSDTTERLTHTHTDFPGGTVVKHLPPNARDAGSTSVWGRPLQKEMVSHSSSLAWEMPRTEEPGGL